MKDQAITKQKNKIEMTGQANTWQVNKDFIQPLFDQLYAAHPAYKDALQLLGQIVDKAAEERSDFLRAIDVKKQDHWFLSNKICGMSLYVDRFCGNLQQLEKRLDYFEELGVNFLHLMPLFESPENESDGGYAVSDFRKVSARFGNLEQLQQLIHTMGERDIYLMLDIVLNHTSHHHAWAEKAKQGDKKYQDYFYMFNSREETEAYEKAMPEVFPESAPGNFTYIPECDKWVMTVFHDYQWDVNFSNPYLFLEMLENIFFYANIGVDMLRIDAPAFIWKRPGTDCQNLPEAHVILKLIKKCVKAATPGMALLAEAIVAPQEIMKYFGNGEYDTKECDAAYNATQMALQWDALATGDTRIMMAAQGDLQQKPVGATWINYTRCHDDIGLAYNDRSIEEAGYHPWHHRKFLQDYYSGVFEGSQATGALFSSNPKTGDARISGSLASLCGLEKAMAENDPVRIETAIQKILLMQAHCIFLGGIPMLFYGDERGRTNDYSYLDDPGKSYDNRWMHRPVYDWNIIDHGKDVPSSIEIFKGTQRLLQLRKEQAVLRDQKRIQWMNTENKHLAAYIHEWKGERLIGIYNFSQHSTGISWYHFKKHGCFFQQPLRELISNRQIIVGRDDELLMFEPYQFFLLSPVREEN